MLGNLIFFKLYIFAITIRWFVVKSTLLVTMISGVDINVGYKRRMFQLFKRSFNDIYYE